MTYLDQWNALSSRIRGLAQAGQLDARYLGVRSSDTFGRAERLREHSESLLEAIRDFRERYQTSLPPAAILSIDDFVTNTGNLITETAGTQALKQERVWAALVLLRAFETELSYILHDIQQIIRVRSERAFAHLQRSIAADPTFRNKWKEAFEAGEVACEKLGAVHLLQHGIWAFKVSAAWAATDLVYQEPPSDLDEVQRYTDGLVLTEWKKAPRAAIATQLFADARSQAQAYAQGLLGGTLLTTYRYAVVVSQQQVEVPDDVTADGIVYRHINIAVDPLSPSRVRSSRRARD